VSSTAVALGAVILALLALLTQFKSTITILDGAFLLDGYAIFLDVIILSAAAIALLLTVADIIPGESRSGELAGLLLLATDGSDARRVRRRDGRPAARPRAARGQPLPAGGAGASRR